MDGFWHICLEIFFKCLDLLYWYFWQFFVNLGTFFTVLAVSSDFTSFFFSCIFRCWHFWAFLFRNSSPSTVIFVMSWSKINVIIFWIILGGSVQCASVLHCTGDALLDCTVRLVGAAGWLPSSCLRRAIHKLQQHWGDNVIFSFTCRAFLQQLWG